jgi:hypothetical protein
MLDIIATGFLTRSLVKKAKDKGRSPLWGALGLSAIGGELVGVVGGFALGAEDAVLILAFGGLAVGGGIAWFVVESLESRIPPDQSIDEIDQTFR